MPSSRRNFLQTLAALPLINATTVAAQAQKTTWPISCNTYNWSTFYGRQGKNWENDLDAFCTEFRQTGITTIEPSLTTVEGTQKLMNAFKKHGIAVPSAYVNTLLHEPDKATESIQSVLQLADEAIKYGTKIFVTNPTPLRWGGKEVKNDKQLIEQAKNLEKLGAGLRQKGITLAYHTHDMEMLAGAREFHHVMQNTSPKNVAFCMDTHWMYRGSENSEVAVFDTLKMYGSRIVELHIRQSKGGIWTETFSGEGDIDYRRYAQQLLAMKIRPLIVIEQSVEAKTPNTMNGVEAHKIDLAAVKDVFKGLV
jgi:inosose dehydratase